MSVKKSASSSHKPVTAQTVIESLKRLASKATRDGMARYAIPSEKAFGVKVSDMQKLARQIGRNHELALALWQTGWYEARMTAAYLDEPDKITPAQMDRWCKDFDNWAIVDTICFCLFDRTRHAFAKIKQWTTRSNEFQKRAAFALLWSVSLHNKSESDETFLDCLPLIERAASDERNFVKKSVVMALRAVGQRSGNLYEASSLLAQRLAASTNATARWVGKETLKKLNSPSTRRRAAKRKLF